LIGKTREVVVFVEVSRTVEWARQRSSTNLSQGLPVCVTAGMVETPTGSARIHGQSRDDSDIFQRAFHNVLPVHAFFHFSFTSRGPPSSSPKRRRDSHLRPAKPPEVCGVLFPESTPVNADAASAGNPASARHSARASFARTSCSGQRVTFEARQTDRVWTLPTSAVSGGARGGAAGS